MIAIVDGHVVERPARELSDRDAHMVTAALAAAGIRVEPVLCDHVVHLWAKRPCSVEQEVRALAMFFAVTDCRLAWHGAGAS